MNEQTLISKVWNYAHVLRDEGVSYGDYVGQISFLLFLKMDEERTKFLGEGSLIPEEYQWDTLRTKSGEALDKHYKEALAALSKRTDFVGTLFLKAESKINDPARLTRLVSLIDGETWMGVNVDVKGTIYEGLLERNAGEVKSGAGQYFTPRPLIQAMVEVVDPQPGETVCDPACGTGGFLLAAYEHMKIKPAAKDRRVSEKLRREGFRVRADLDDFVSAYKSGRQHERKESERFKRFAYDDLAKRDKLNLDISWLKDDDHIDPDSLPPPEEVAAEIVANLELALEKFRNVAAALAAPEQA